MISLLYLGITIFTVFVTAAKKRDIFSPPRLYIALYSLLLCLESLKLSAFQSPWVTSTKLLFWGSTGFFLAGSCIAFLLEKTGKQTPSLSSVIPAIRNHADQIDWEWFKRVWLFCAVVFLASFGGAWWIEKGLPIFAKEPDEARLAFFSANIASNYGLFLGPMALMLGIEMLCMGKMRKQTQLLVGGLSLIILLVYFTIVTRFDLFRFFVFAIVVFHYSRRNLSLLQIVSFVTAGFVLFMAAFLVRINLNAVGAFNEVLKIRMPPGLEWASNIYGYAVGTFWNLDFAMQQYYEGVRAYPLGYGFDLFRPILFFLQLEEQLISAYGFDSIYNKSVVKMEAFNTVIYCWHFFKDFGMIGAFILSAIAGFSLSKYYYGVLSEPTPLKVSLWAVFVPCILLSFHAPLWELWFFYVNIIIIFIAHRKLTLF